MNRELYELNLEIQKVRRELEKVLEEYEGNITENDLIIKISEKLDCLVVKYMKISKCEKRHMKD